MTTVLDALRIALTDVDNLIEHHPKSAKPERGRPAGDEGPLLRSCVLLTYAAWEVYVEDSLIWTVERLAEAPHVDALPEALRAFVAEHVQPDPWRIAGDAWRQTTVDIVTTKVRGSEDGNSYGMNTAGPRQIIALHDQVLGERPLNRCKWQSMSNKRVKEELASLVKIRGSIAHTGQAPGALRLGGARDWRKFVLRLAERLDPLLEDLVQRRLAQAA